MRARFAVVLVLAVLLASCGDDASVSSTTTTAAPTTTEAATTTTTVAPTTMTSALSVWDVVALGDSYVAGAGLGSNGGDDPDKAFPGIYTRALGEQLGVEAVLHPYVAYGTVAQWSADLAADDTMQADLQEAEVVIVWLGYHNVIDPLYHQSCGTDWPGPLLTCLQEATGTMPADFDQLLGTIEDLVPEGAIVMVANQSLSPREIGEWGDEPFWPELKAVAFDGWSAGVEAAAAAHGAVFVDSAVFITGPEGNQLLLPREFLLPDGIHMTEAGHRALADLFLAADGL